MRKTSDSDVRGWMALENITSHFSTMLEPVASASFLSSLSIIHGLTNANPFEVGPPQLQTCCARPVEKSPLTNAKFTYPWYPNILKGGKTHCFNKVRNTTFFARVEYEGKRN